jgi:solute carrier family 25 phosphate transporter 23/24/25/41
MLVPGNRDHGSRVFCNHIPDQQTDIRLTYRNFLLFLPTHKPCLNVILSYYSSTVTVNAEGDTHVSDEEAQGLGIISLLFGSIINIASPSRSSQPIDMVSVEVEPSVESPVPKVLEDAVELPTLLLETVESSKAAVKTVLTESPHSGYFVAGGLSGAVSRTATAPLDRLKVYLIAKTDVTKDSIAAVKSGNPKAVVKNAGRPLIDATKYLWRAGGVRNFFAGNRKPCPMWASLC